MREVTHYEKEVMTIREDALVCDVAERMEAEGVGCLVVENAEGHPVGVLTDRDLALRVVAAGRDAGATTAGAVMSRPLVAAESTDSLERVIGRMSSAGIRRVPVLKDGRLSGLVSLDDLVAELADELGDLAAPARARAREGHFRGRLEDLRGEFEARLSRLRGQVEQTGTQMKDTLRRELEALRERLRGSAPH